MVITIWPICLPSNTAIFLKTRFPWGLSVISCLCYHFFLHLREKVILFADCNSCCLVGVYLQDECLVLISLFRTKVALSLSSESFWTSLLQCVHALFLLQCQVPCWDSSSYQRNRGSLGDKSCSHGWNCETTTLICWRVMESWALYCVLPVPIPAEVNQAAALPPLNMGNTKWGKDLGKQEPLGMLAFPRRLSCTQFWQINALTQCHQLHIILFWGRWEQCWKWLSS